MKHKGFTLVEILVAMSVIVTATGFMVVSYGSFSTSERLRQTGKTFRNNLRFVQTRAVSGLKPEQGANCTTLRGYEISFTETSYSYAALCDGVEPQGTVTVALPQGVGFYPIPSPIEFAVLTGNASRSETVALTAGGKGYNIYVDAGGDISDLGSQPIMTIMPTPTNNPDAPLSPTATTRPQTTANPYATRTPFLSPTPSRTPTATVTPSLTPTPTSIPTPTSYWFPFCSEYETCTFTGTRQVRYGATGGSTCQYSTPRTMTNSTTCTNATFGDPCPGPVKKCEYSIDGSFDLSSVFVGSYFSNKTLTGTPVLVRHDSTINYNWGTGNPTFLPADNFSIRWSKTQSFATTTNKTFTITADDGVRLIVDGVTVLDKWKDQAPTTYTYSHTFSAGTHTIVLEYYESAGGASISMSY